MGYKLVHGLWYRICRSCGDAIAYTRYNSFRAAERKGVVCIMCAAALSHGDILPSERACPTCKNIIYYNTRSAYNNALKNNRNCLACSAKLRCKPPSSIETWDRNCPDCDIVLSYSVKDSRDRANKIGTRCGKCARLYRAGIRFNRDSAPGPFIRQCPDCSGDILYNKFISCRAASYRKARCADCLRLRLSEANSNPTEVTRQRKSVAQRKRRGTTLISGESPPLGLLDTWALDVKRRDKWICQICRASKSLHAHHIKPRSLYPDEALDLTNGVTLCIKCHWATHRGEHPEFLVVPEGFSITLNSLGNRRFNKELSLV